MVKGYWLIHAADFLGSNHFDSRTAERLENGLSPQLKSTLRGLKPTTWCERRHLSEILAAVASVKNEDQGAAADLMACGRFVNLRISNQFTKLALGLLTPATFVKKLPLFWKRDHGYGECEIAAADASGRRAELKLKGVGGYDHVGPAWLGWLEASLAALSAGESALRQTGWTLSSPGPSEIACEVRWS